MQTPSEFKPDSENADDESEKPEAAYFNKKEKLLYRKKRSLRILLSFPVLGH